VRCDSTDEPAPSTINGPSTSSGGGPRRVRGGGCQGGEGQADWFALVAVNEPYQPAVDGALKVPYSVAIH